jgi:hypothetical protein
MAPSLEVSGGDGGRRGDGIGEMPSGGGTSTEDSCDVVAAAVERFLLLDVRNWVFRGWATFRRAKLPLIAVRMVLRRYCASAMVLRTLVGKLRMVDSSCSVATFSRS